MSMLKHLLNNPVGSPPKSKGLLQNLLANPVKNSAVRKPLRQVSTNAPANGKLLQNMLKRPISNPKVRTNASVQAQGDIPGGGGGSRRYGADVNGFGAPDPNAYDNIGAALQRDAATANAVTSSAAPASKGMRQGAYDATLGKLDGKFGPGHHKADFEGKGFTGSMKEMGNWFWSGSGKDKAWKVGGGIAAYAGVNMVGRGMSGGGITHNNSGERDIMGIPFV